MSRDRLSEALRRHFESTELKPGRVHHVVIRHDDECGHWQGDPCDCEPSIETGARVDREYGGDA